MEPRRLSVRICQFPYSGNGASSATHPDVGDWITRVALAAHADKRICSLDIERYCDTPITMTRNKAVTDARKAGIDVLIMVDSDQAPDFLLGKDPLAQPFFESSFEYLYKHWERGPVAIASPYCGPPPDECVYAFLWRDKMGDVPTDTPNMALQMYTRQEAATLAGIQEAGGFATGLSMYDMRVFELTDPKPQYERLIEQYGLDPEEARQRVHPWFYYEWDSMYQDGKGSTEDVTFSRDLALIGYQKLGYNPVKINWSAWAGHWKPKLVCKPQPLRMEEIGMKYQLAMENKVSRYDRKEVVNFKLPPNSRIMLPEIFGDNVTYTEELKPYVGNGSVE